MVFLGWSLIDMNKECHGGMEYDYGYLPTEDHCAAQCFGITPYFNYGKRKFGNNLCGGDCCTLKGCKCICVTGTGKDLVCAVKDNKGFDGYELIDTQKEG